MNPNQPVNPNDYNSPAQPSQQPISSVPSSNPYLQQPQPMQAPAQPQSIAPPPMPGAPIQQQPVYQPGQVSMNSSHKTAPWVFIVLGIVVLGAIGLLIATLLLM